MSNRRDFIKKATLAGFVSAIMPKTLSAEETSKTQQLNFKSKRALRVAHITDVHLLNQPLAETCFARVLRELNTMKDRPDLIINTGDSLMDANKQTRETVQTGWNSWNKIITAENKIEIKSILGNHDVWHGADDALDNEYKNDKRYGKQWAIDMLAMPNRYYTFDKNGWRFFALDSMNGKAGYQLDDEQYNWLKDELAKTPSSTPVCVVNHVPVLSMGALLTYTRHTPIEDVKFPSGTMHNDHQRIKDLFFNHKNVKLNLSGHVHYVDTVEYLGVKYMCNGAVCGNWWKSPLALEEFPPVYTVLDLFEDGTILHQHVYYNTSI